MIVIQRRFSDVRVKETEISPTIEMSGGGGGGNLPMVVVEHEAKDTDNAERSGGEQMSWNYDELASTLRANTKHHEPIVVLKSAGFGYEHSAKSRGIGWQEECSPTLRGGSHLR